LPLGETHHNDPPLSALGAAEAPGIQLASVREAVNVFRQEDQGGGEVAGVNVQLTLRAILSVLFRANVGQHLGMCALTFGASECSVKGLVKEVGGREPVMTLNLYFQPQQWQHGLVD